MSNDSDKEFKLFSFEPIGLLIAKPTQPPPFLIDGFLIEGGLSIFAGKPKEGKSTLVRHILKAIAYGEEFCGISTKKGNCLYLALEEHEHFLKEHFVNLGCDKNDDQISVRFSVHGYNEKEILESLKNEIQQFNCRLLVIDPAIKLFPKLEVNNYEDVSQAVGHLHALARENNCHILLVHHTNKSQGGGFDKVLGSTAWFSSVDTAVLVERFDDLGTFVSRQRYGFDIEKMYFKLNAQKTISEFGLFKELHPENIKNLLVTLFESPATELSIEQICEKIQSKKQTVLDCLKEQIADGVLEKIGQGLKNKPYIYRKCRSQPTFPISGTASVLKKDGEL